MKIAVRIAALALLSITPNLGCTFGRLPRPQDPILAATAPCFTGEVCPIPFDGAYGWTLEAIHTATH